MTTPTEVSAMRVAYLVNQYPKTSHSFVRREIEGVVANMDGVLEAACIGVPDDRTDESVKLFVVKTPEAEVSAEQIIAYCRDNLTAYKVPRQIVFIDELPKSAVGKILRRELRT